MKKFTVLSLFAAALLAVSSFSVALAQISPEQEKAIWEAANDKILIETIQKPGEEPQDIYAKMLACKKLGRIGSEAAIPELVKMLASEKLNFIARYALEPMPSKKVDEVLRKAAAELSGACLVGVIDTIGVRKDVAAVSLLKDLLAKKPEPQVKKAIYAALGAIANTDCAAILLLELKGDKDANEIVNRGLGDAILDAAQKFEAEGKIDTAKDLFNAVVVDRFPVFIQKAGAYHGLLICKGEGAPILAEKLQSPKLCCFTGALKAIRAFAPNDSAKIVGTVLDTYGKLQEERKAFVIRALGDRTDKVSQDMIIGNLADPKAPKFLLDQFNIGSEDVKCAVLYALSKIDYDKNKAAVRLVHDVADILVKKPSLKQIDSLRLCLSSSSSKEIAKLVEEEINEWCSDTNKLLALDEINQLLIIAFLNNAGDLRVSKAVPSLVRIATFNGINKSISDAAVDALSNIVTLDQFSQMLDILKKEKDAQRVDWILKAICTRLPREECAAEVGKVFEKSSAEKKAELLSVLMQIGGKTALKCVVDACWKEDTADKATEILGSWNTPDDVEEVAAACMQLATSAPNNKYRIRGIRSYIRIPRQFNLPITQKIAMCQKAFDVAVRPADKDLVFDVFTRIVEVSSVEAALSYVKSNSAYKERACSVAVTVAEKITFKGESKSSRAKLCALMNQVLETSSNKDLKVRAQKVIDRWK